jgi:hypothetical protein
LTALYEKGQAGFDSYDNVKSFMALLVDFENTTDRLVIFEQIQTIEAKYPFLYDGIRRNIRHVTSERSIHGKTEQLFFDIKKHLAPAHERNSPMFDVDTYFTPQLKPVEKKAAVLPEDVKKDYQKRYEKLIHRMIDCYDTLAALESRQTLSKSQQRRKEETETLLMGTCYKAIQINALLTQNDQLHLDASAALTVNDQNIYSDSFLSAQLTQAMPLSQVTTISWAEKITTSFRRLFHLAAPESHQNKQDKAYQKAKTLLEDKIVGADLKPQTEKFSLMREQYAKSTTLKLVQTQEVLQRVQSCGFLLGRKLHKKIDKEIEHLNKQPLFSFFKEKGSEDKKFFLELVRAASLARNLCLSFDTKDQCYYLQFLSGTMPLNDKIDISSEQFIKLQKRHIFVDKNSETKNLADSMIENILQQAKNSGNKKINGMSIEPGMYQARTPSK